MSRRRVISIAVAVLLSGLLALLLCHHYAPERSLPTGSPRARTLHFPPSRSLGKLGIRNWGTDETWQDLGPAQRNVAVPAGKELALWIERQPPNDSLWARLSYRLGLRSQRARARVPRDAIDLSPLAGLRPYDLQLLYLAALEIGDDQMVYLKGLTGLRELCLSLNPITDAGLAHLRGLTSLNLLNLGGTKISDAGLAYLTGMDRLERLDLSGTPVTDAGLDGLKTLTALQKVWIDGTSVTRQGRRNLEQALPNCLTETHGSR